MRFLALLVLTGCIPEATSTNEQALTGREGVDAEEPDDRPIVRIMPLGDSITAQHGSYRLRLYQLLSQDDVRVDFVGSVSSPIDPVPDRDHEGHPSLHIVQLDVENWLPAAPADLVILHIGTNDIITDTSPEVAAARLDALIARIYRVSPRQPLIVTQIVPLRSTGTYWRRNPRIADFNGRMPAIVDRWRAAGKLIELVDCFNGYDTAAWFMDDVHPSATGFAFMADRIFPAARALVGEP